MVLGGKIDQSSLLVCKLILCFEVLVIVGLVIALISLNGTRGQGNELGHQTEQKSSKIDCESLEYKKYNDRVYYGDWLDEAENKDYFGIITDAIEKVREDPEVKVVIDDIQAVLDDVTIKGYQVVDGVILADTWFAVSADTEEAASTFGSLFVSPEMVSKDGLVDADAAVASAQFALEEEVGSDEQALKYLSDECSYVLEYSHKISLSGKSGYYYDVEFRKGLVKIDAATNQLIDLYMRPEVIH